MKGEHAIADDGEWIAEKVDLLRSKLDDRIGEINEILSTGMSAAAIDATVTACRNEIKDALFGEGDGWRSLFPGKHLLEIYASEEGLGKAPAFQNSLIKQFSATREKIPPELMRLITAIAEGKVFS